MKRLIAVIAVAALATSLGTSVAHAAPKPKKFANCAALNATYPNGVAATTAAATAIEAALHFRPTTNKAVYNANVKLDQPRNGTVCEVALPKSAPSAVQNLRVISQSATGANLAWDAPASNGNSPITSYVINGSAGSAAIAGTTAIITGLSAGTAYAFTVSAVNGIGTSDPAPVNVTTPAAPTPTPTPAAATPTAVKYANCTAAKAAGVTPIRRDTNPALYALNSGLDRDKDGIACD
jgi:hypothetical protein